MTAKIKQRLGAALAWWSAGLLSALPARWAAKLVTPIDTMTVTRQADELVFKLYDGDGTALLEQRSMDVGDAAAQDEVNRWFAQRQRNVRLVLLLPGAALLEKRLVYPLSAAPDLRALLAFCVITAPRRCKPRHRRPDNSLPWTVPGFYQPNHASPRRRCSCC
ncbi:MAG: hypothetical protein OXD47_04270 [Gammaproteobacteria bacterium]|nr:hypothetical protein [Gammaproteobacteria bacterium]